MRAFGLGGRATLGPFVRCLQREVIPPLAMVLLLSGCWPVESSAASKSALPVSSSAPAPAGTAAALASGSTSSAATAAAAGATGRVAPRPPAALTLPPLPTIPVVDLHVDTPWKVHFKGRSVALKRGHATPKTLEAGGYRGIVYPIYLADYLNDGHPRIADADAVLKTIRKMVRAHDILAWAPGQPGFTGLPLPPGRIGVYIAIEGAGAFADDITQIDRFIAAGVRLVGPVHAGDNRLSTSATGRNARGQGKKKGLSELGRALCERVYRAGALVDVSHMSDAAFADLEPIAARFSAPIVATHSNARALSPHPRNLTDTQLRAIAKTGGVAGLNIYKGFVGRGRHPKLRDVVAQVEHMVKVAGIEHVAIGSDYDGGTPVAALADASAWPKLITALRKAGFGDAALRKLFAENALRILAYRPTSARP